VSNPLYQLDTVGYTQKVKFDKASTLNFSNQLIQSFYDPKSLYIVDRGV